MNPRIEVLQTSPLDLLGTAPPVCQYNGTATLLSVYSLPLANPAGLVHNRKRFMSPIHGYRVRAESGDPENASAPSGDQTWAYGSCLYLGPNGQRCPRPALEGGFCARHAADAISASPWAWFRRLAGLLVAAAILWPIIQSFLEELSHLRH